MGLTQLDMFRKNHPLWKTRNTYRSKVDFNFYLLFPWLPTYMVRCVDFKICLQILTLIPSRMGLANLNDHGQPTECKGGTMGNSQGFCQRRLCIFSLVSQGSQLSGRKIQPPRIWSNHPELATLERSHAGILLCSPKELPANNWHHW